MMEDLYFITIDVSNKTSEEIGEIIDKAMAREEFIILENKNCGYSSFIVPTKSITSEHLLQSIQMEPLMGTVHEYAEQLQKELHSLKEFFKK